MLAVSDAAALVADRIDPLLDQAIGDFGITREDSGNAAVASRHAAGLLAKKDARGEAGFPPRPVSVVAGNSHNWRGG